jgi:hypothetical protein
MNGAISIQESEEHQIEIVNNENIVCNLHKLFVYHHPKHSKFRNFGVLIVSQLNGNNGSATNTDDHAARAGRGGGRAGNPRMHHVRPHNANQPRYCVVCNVDIVAAGRVVCACPAHVHFWCQMHGVHQCGCVAAPVQAPVAPVPRAPDVFDLRLANVQGVNIEAVREACLDAVSATAASIMAVELERDLRAQWRPVFNTGAEVMFVEREDLGCCHSDTLAWIFGSATSTHDVVLANGTTHYQQLPRRSIFEFLDGSHGLHDPRRKHKFCAMDCKIGGTLDTLLERCWRIHRGFMKEYNWSHVRHVQVDRDILREHMLKYQDKITMNPTVLFTHISAAVDRDDLAFGVDPQVLGFTKVVLLQQTLIRQYDLKMAIPGRVNGVATITLPN